MVLGTGWHVNSSMRNRESKVNAHGTGHGHGVNIHPTIRLVKLLKVEDTHILLRLRRVLAYRGVGMGLGPSNVRAFVDNYAFTSSE